jgi:hypothetical protein
MDLPFSESECLVDLLMVGKTMQGDEHFTGDAVWLELGHGLACRLT